MRSSLKSYFNKEYFVYFLFFGIVLFGIIKGTFSKGDFIGYILTGKLVAQGDFIYNEFLNTWPPLFALFCTPFAIITDNTRPILYFFWLLATVWVFIWSIKFLIKFIKKSNFSIFEKQGHLALNHKFIAIPLMLIVKFLLDNMVNVQINIFFFALCLLMINYYNKEKALMVGFLLALTISLKVYTIFFLAYFIYKRAFKVAGWTTLFLLILNSIPFLVWGYDEALRSYSHWVTEIVPYRSDFVDHKNQSIFGTFFRFFTTQDPGHNMYVYFLDLAPETVKKLIYLTVGFLALIPLYLFRKKVKNKNSLNAIIEYSILFTAIPILSPISWKAYFIFLWVPIFLVFQLLYYSSASQLRFVKTLRIVFIIAMCLLILSSDMFSGRYFSDVLEAYSAYTLGAGLLMLIQFVFLFKMNESKVVVVLE